MPNRFVAFDVETANYDMSSICQVGVVTFESGTVIDSWGALIDPQVFFHHVHVSIHGINEETVRGAPTFSDVSKRLCAALAGSVVATHMPFDRIALAKACDKHDLPGVDDATWLDTARVVRRAWPQFGRKGYGLGSITSWLNIEFKHHDAEEDARAAGLVLLRAITDSGLSLDEWIVPATTYSPAGTIKRTGSHDGPLAGEVVVFTGTLSIFRQEAADMAARAGCDVATDVGKKVTLLVVGDQDVHQLGGHEKSSKHRKAEKLILNGQPIRILRESDFRALVSY